MIRHLAKSIAIVAAIPTVFAASAALANDGTSDAATSMAAPLQALTDFLTNSGGSLIIIAGVIFGAATFMLTQRAAPAAIALGVGMFVGYGAPAITSLAGITAEMPDHLPVVELLADGAATDVVTLDPTEYTPLEG